MAEPCDDLYGGCTNTNKKRFGFAWKHGTVLGLTSKEFLVFPSWTQGVWNSVCVSASASLGLLSVNINDGEMMFRSEEYDGYHTKHQANIALMGRSTGWDKQFPVHGAVTDVNIFSRILGEEEAGDWARCRGQPGDILDWSTAQL